MSQAWFYVAASISGLEQDGGRCWNKKSGIFHLILSQIMGILTNSVFFQN